MSWRLFGVALLCVLGAFVNLFFLSVEDVVEPEAAATEEAVAGPLFGLRYAPDQRASNLAKMGFEPEEIAAMTARITSLETRFHVDDPVQNRFLALFDHSPDKDGLTRALCGTGVRSGAEANLPVPYEALKYLVHSENGRLEVVQLDQVVELEFQDWTSSARIDAVYAEVEKAPDRKGDATRMALAALLAGPGGEDKLLRRRGGWGNSFWSPWSWAIVKEENPGLSERLFRYVELVHLAAEQAAGDRGICKG